MANLTWEIYLVYCVCIFKCYSTHSHRCTDVYVMFWLSSSYALFSIQLFQLWRLALLGETFNCIKLAGDIYYLLEISICRLKLKSLLWELSLPIVLLVVLFWLIFFIIVPHFSNYVCQRLYGFTQLDISVSLTQPWAYFPTHTLLLHCK